MKVGCGDANFRRFASKIGYHLNDREKKVGLVMPPMCAFPESLVNVGQVRSEVIGLQGDRLKEDDERK